MISIKLRTPAHRDNGDGRRELEHLVGPLKFQPTPVVDQSQVLEGRPIKIEVAAIGRGLFSAVVALNRGPTAADAGVLL
jgi:hypothetical protein